MSERLRNAMREARRESGLSWERFARDVGFSPAYLRNVENGNRAVTADVAAAYDRVLRSGGRFAQTLAADGPSTAGWDQDATALSVLAELVDGRRVDRRSFVTAGVALSASAGHWGNALGRARSDHPAQADGGPELLANIENRLDHLRRVDDELGSGEVRKQAASELSLAVTLLKTGRYPGPVSTRLYRIASEAARQVAWCSFDQGRPGTAQCYFDASLRASAEAGDVIGGAYALSFAAVQCYSTPGQAHRAVALLDAARAEVRGRSTPRMEAMLAARTARALSKTGAKTAAGHQLHLAHAALDKGARDDDPDFLYWVTYGEVEMIAGSSALDLGDPGEALRRFEAGMRAYPGVGEFRRSHAIYLARAAEAHLAQDDLDAAVATARRAAACLGSVDSARSASQLKGLRDKLTPHTAYRPVRDFLEEAG
ncbi:helix-turn-helix transcriptional regulator [Kitasatospora sp. NPDC059577]|uniref:helix-turn-helix transcriptional regulator n=1 Tax=Kitasatospora sp. NPDC059577 TaxID=3346873 RepID=UPI0036A8ECDD